MGFLLRSFWVNANCRRHLSLRIQSQRVGARVGEECLESQRKTGQAFVPQIG
jgi:hypothetical protein